MSEPDAVARAAAPHWIGRLRRSAAALALAVPLLALFSPVLFFGRALYVRDTGLAFYPHKALVAAALREGRLPQWTPGEYAGMPVAADPNFTVFHPLSFVTALLPMPWGYQVFVAACVLVGAFGARALARELGASGEGALIAAVCWAWSGPFLSVAMTGQVAAPAFLPWLCAAGARLARDRSGRAVALAAIATALAALAGTPETGGCGVAIAIALAARGGARAALRCLGGVALGAAVAAVQIVPTALFLRESSRGAGLEPAEALAGSLVPARLPNLLVPFFGGAQDAAGTTSWLPGAGLTWVEDLHLGAIPVLLALASFQARDARKRAALWIAAGVFLLLAVGEATPLYRMLWTVLPPLRRVRFPEKFVLPLALAVAVAAGAGWERLRLEAGGLRRRLVGATVLAASAIGLWLAAPHIAPSRLSPRELACLRDTALRTGPVALAVAAAGLALAALVAGRRVSPRAALIGGVALLAVDLVPPALRLFWTVPASLLEAPSAVADLVRHDAGSEARLFRVDVESTGIGPEDADAIGEPSWDRPTRIYWLRHNALFHPGAQQGELLLMRGYASYTPGRTRQLLRDGGKAGVDALSVRYGVEFGSARPSGSVYARLGFEPLASFRSGYLRVWRNPGARARVRLASAALASGAPAPACAAIRVLPGDFDAVPEDLRAASCDRVREPAGTARLTGDEPESLEAAVETPSPVFLVVADSISAGWSVAVDGAPARLWEADGALRAVLVPPGQHSATFSYRTPGLMAGAAVSLAGAFGALLLFLRRRAGPREEKGPG